MRFALRNAHFFKFFKCQLSTALKQTYSLFEDASGETIVEDVPGASQAARKPNKPIKITIFFISV